MFAAEKYSLYSLGFSTAGASMYEETSLLKLHLCKAVKLGLFHQIK